MYYSDISILICMYSSDIKYPDMHQTVQLFIDANTVFIDVNTRVYNETMYYHTSNSSATVERRCKAAYDVNSVYRYKHRCF